LRRITRDALTEWTASLLPGLRNAGRPHDRCFFILAGMLKQNLICEDLDEQNIISKEIVRTFQLIRSAAGQQGKRY
jgi:hypothetical protein